MIFLRFEILKLPILAYRRKCGDMLEVYKLLQGKYDGNVYNIVKLRKDNDTSVNSFKNRLDKIGVQKNFSTTTNPPCQEVVGHFNGKLKI